MDFTISKYVELLEALKRAGYQTNAKAERMIILRHDVDKLPENSLRLAMIEHDMGFKAVYYFRSVTKSWNPIIIKQIAALGHEVGYHYECLTSCNGDVDAAYCDFKVNLSRLSNLLGRPVTSICMHGSPLSKWDSRNIWHKYDYKKLGIYGNVELGLPGEPYMETDWYQMFYLTDTGRRWDGYKVSVRDRIYGCHDIWESAGLVFHSTDDIISRINAGSFPSRVMMTTHPQRWMPFGMGWLNELMGQNTKNIAKRFIKKAKK